MPPNPLGLQEQSRHVATLLPRQEPESSKMSPGQFTAHAELIFKFLKYENAKTSYNLGEITHSIDKGFMSRVSQELPQINKENMNLPEDRAEQMLSGRGNASGGRSGRLCCPRWGQGPPAGSQGTGLGPQPAAEPSERTRLHSGGAPPASPVLPAGG